MAGGGEGFGKRRKGITNLNLVPFVDLFSTLIIFLISTAVWDDLAAVQVNLGAHDRPAVEVAPEDVKKITSNVKVTLSDGAVEVFDEGRVQRFQKPAGGEWDFTPFERWVGDMRAKYADKRDMLILATDAANYEDLVAVMDRTLAQNFTQLVVTGQEQK